MTLVEIEELLSKCDSCLKNDNYPNAEVLCRKVMDELSNTNTILIVDSIEFIENQCICARFLSQALWRQGKLKESLPFAENALSLSIQINNKSLTAKCLDNLATVHAQLSEYDEALELFNKALDLHQELMDMIAVAKTLSNIGNTYRYLADFPCSIEYLTRAISIFSEKDALSEIATAKGNLALTYQKLGDFNTALNYYEETLLIFERLSMHSEVACTIGNIGLLYLFMSDNARALEFFNRSLSLNTELGMYAEVVRNIANIGHIHTSNKDYDLALSYFNQSLQLLLSTGDKNTFGKVNSFIAKVHRLRNELDESLKYYASALAIHIEIGDKLSEAITMSNIGTIYGDNSFHGYDASLSEKFILGSIDLHITLDSKRHLLDSYQNAIYLYEQESRCDKALEYFKKYHQLTLEVQNEEVKKQADKFAWERKLSDTNKEREIETLRSEAEKAVLEETINQQKKRLEVQAIEVEHSIQELVKKNGLLQQIQSDIKKIAPFTMREGIEYIVQLKDRVSRHITPLDSEKELDKQWMVTHGCFIKNLQLSFPDLTTMELKIAVLLNMKFTTSNIGSALFLSKRTVEFHRHNLRKKMKLNTNHDIYQVLASYATQ
jgi:tetratricopeptide (TPR) repeat protein/DNA-binding CsgD family transcriptional regulator